MFSFFRTVDKAGRLVIPKDLRRILRLNPGDGVVLQLWEGAILLRPATENDPDGRFSENSEKY